MKRERKSSMKGGGWSFALLRAMDDRKQVVESYDDVVIIRDAFPKARHHYLVITRRDIESLTDLTRDHVTLLESMLTRGEKLVEKIRREGSEMSRFQLGYHAVPSMRRLHMHVISQDFDSDRLKHAKHWNSFTSSFFLDASEVIRTLKEEGRVEIDRDYYERLLKEPLKCHVCRRSLANMPTLKRHIREHLSRKSDVG